MQFLTEMNCNFWGLGFVVGWWGEVGRLVVGAKRERFPSLLWYGVYFSGLKPVALGEISEFWGTSPNIQENKQKHGEAESLDIIMTE